MIAGATTGPAPAATYYVATNGSDAANGSFATPYRTIQKAASVMTAGDLCYIRGGTYRETVTPANSGTDAARITYAGYSNETVIISGLDPVTNTWTLDNGSVYKVSGINPGLASNQGNQVFINGNLAYEARWPNNVGTPGSPNDFTYATVARSEAGNVITTTGGTNLLMLQDSSLPFANNTDLTGATIWCGRNVNFYNNIVAKVNSYSAATREIFFTDDGGNSPPVANSMYIIWGARALLDTTNEWYYDGANQQLYVWMPDGGMPTSGAVEYKTRIFAFDLNNRNYITISNLTTWACGIWGPNAANSTPTSSGIRLLSLRGLHPQSNVNRSGFYLSGNSNEVTGCEMAYSPARLLEVRGNDCRVINNYLHDGSQYYTTSLLITKGKRMIVSHNTLCDGANQLVNPDITSGAFQYNHLYRAMWHCKDEGLSYINYTDGQGSQMHHNVLHDNLCQLRTDQAHAFYQDGGVSDYIYYRNLIYNIPAGNAFFFGTIFSTLIYNNTLYQAKNHVIPYGLNPATSASSGLFANNVAPLSPAATPSAWDLRNFYSDYPNPAFAGATNYDFRPTPASPHLDKAAIVSGVSTNYTGLAPDGGAYEYGDALFKAGHDFNNPPDPALLVLPNLASFEFRNLVLNGSLEDADYPATNWTFTGTARVNATADSSSASNVGARTFNGSFRIDFPPGTGAASQTVSNLTPATRYVATAYFQVPGGESATSAQLAVSGHGGASLTNFAPVTGATSWTNIDIYFITGPAATGATLTVQCTVANAGDTNRVDLVCLRKGPPPVLPALPNLAINPWAPQLRVAVAATYATAGGVVNYQLDSAPAGASINLTNGVLTWDATGQTNGTYNFMVRAFDRDYAAAHYNQAAFQVLVTNAWTVPALTNSVGNPMTINAAVSGNAATNPAVVYSLGGGAPAGAVINPSTGVITWTPTNSGAFAIPVVATLGGATQNVTVAANITEMAVWYPFDGAYGGAVPPGPSAVFSAFTPDASGNGLDAALYGGAELAPGKTGNALHTPRGTGWAQMPGGVLSKITGDFTIACWLRMDSANWFARAYSFSVSRANGAVYLLPVSYLNDPANAGKLRFSMTPASGSGKVLEAGALPNGVWKQVAVTLAGTTLTMYVDGAQAAQSTSWTLHLSDVGLDDINLIGSSADGVFDGKVDDFRIYTRALSAGEIVNLAQAAPGRWTGGGADNNWSTTANWNTGVPPTNSTLWFNTGSRTTSTNNLAAATPLANLNFGTNAGVFNLSGNTLALAGDVVSESTTTQTVGMPLILGSGSHRLYAPSNGRLVLSGSLSGAGQLLLQAKGSVVLTASNPFTGGMEIQSGILKQGAAGALGGGAVNVRAGATLDLGGYDATVALVESGALITNSSATPVTLTISNQADTAIWQTALRGGPIALAKAGAGNLIVHGTPAFAGSVSVLGGTLTLGFQPPVYGSLPIPYALGQRPDAHWDAADLARIVTNASGAVSRWYNSESNATYLAAQDNTNQQPQLVLNALNGLPVVDFGPTGSGTNPGAWMQMATPSSTAPGWTAANGFNTIRSAFWVIRGAGNLLGDDSSADFRRGSPDGSATAPIWSASSASPRLLAGTTFLNGQAVDGTVTPLTTNYNLVSYVGTGGDADNQNRLNGSRLANDQNTVSRSGGQQIAEVLLYSRVLGDDERQQVEAYLANKWFNASPAQLWTNNLPVNLDLSIASNAMVTLTGFQQFGAFSAFAGGQLVASNGTLAVGAGNASSTFAGNILGSASLTKTGTGTTVLTGTNSYTGGTTISAGALQLGDGVATNGYVPGDITNNALLIFANPFAQSFTNVISGTGSLAKTGGGTLTLSGSNNYAGNTTVNAGALSLPAGGAIYSPLAALNIVTGLVSLAGGTINVGSLFATNNTATATNSMFNFTGGRLTTSNAANAVAASLLLGSNGIWNLNGNWNMNGGTNSLAPVTATGLGGGVYIGSNTANVAVNVNAGAVWSLGRQPPGSAAATNNLAVYIGAGGTGATNSTLQINAGILTNGYTVTVGYNAGNSGHQLVITNGGRLYAGNNAAGSASVYAGRLAGANNNGIIVAGTNSAGSKATLDLGQCRLNVGSTTQNTNNWMQVGQGGVVQNGYLFESGINSSIAIVNGGLMAVSTPYIGRSSAYNNSLIVAAADSSGNPATLNANGTILGVGANGSTETNNWARVDQGGLITNVSSVCVGGSTAIDTNNSGNYLVITNGGQLFSKAGCTNGGGLSGNNGNGIYVGGNGARWDLGNSTLLNGGAANTNNSLVVAAGGAMTNFSRLTVGQDATAVSNNVTLSGGTLWGGTMVVKTNNLLAITGGGMATLTNLSLQAAGSACSVSGGTLVARADGDWVSGPGSLTLAGNGMTNDTSTFGVTNSVIMTGGGGIAKTGNGILTLANSNTYTGPTAVNAGTLLVNGAIGASAASVGTDATLGGLGSIAGAVTVQGQGILSPGAGGIGILTVNNTLTLQAGSVTMMKISKAPLTNDQVRVTGLLTYGGTLAVTNLAGTLSGGETFQLFSAGSRSGNFATITGSPGNGLAWSFEPTNGVLTAVASAVSNPPANLKWSISGTNLNINWQSNYTGWVLQSQTSSLTVGLGTNWVDLVTSSLTNQWSTGFQASNPAVFFRLRSP